MRARRNKKLARLIASILGVLAVALAVYFGIKDLRSGAVLSAFEQENGQVYYSFFVALERYTRQTHALPASLEAFQDDYARLGEQAGSWPDEGERFASIVTPDFSVAPAHDSLQRFAPGYAGRSYWARSHCEALWELVIANCE